MGGWIYYPRFSVDNMKNYKEVKERYNMRGVNKYRLQALKKYGGDSILDVGCGAGAYVFSLKNDKNIHGVDFQEFDSWIEEPELFKISPVDSLPYEDEQFDTISCFETLEHLEKPADAIRELHRVVKNNIIITVPNCEVPDVFSKSNLIYSHWNDPTHINFYFKDSLIDLVEANGFKVENFEYINMVNIEKMLQQMMDGENKLKNFLFDIFYLPRIKTSCKHYITMLLIAKKYRNPELTVNAKSKSII